MINSNDIYKLRRNVRILTRQLEKYEKRNEVKDGLDEYALFLSDVRGYLDDVINGAAKPDDSGLKELRLFVEGVKKSRYYETDKNFKPHKVSIYYNDGKYCFRDEKDNDIPLDAEIEKLRIKLNLPRSLIAVLEELKAYFVNKQRTAVAKTGMPDARKNEIEMLGDLIKQVQFCAKNDIRDELAKIRELVEVDAEQIRWYSLSKVRDSLEERSDLLEKLKTANKVSFEEFKGRNEGRYYIEDRKAPELLRANKTKVVNDNAVKTQINERIKSSRQKAISVGVIIVAVAIVVSLALGGIKYYLSHRSTAAPEPQNAVVCLLDGE